VESYPPQEHRFEKLLVPESSRDEAVESLRGLRPEWEEHHRIKISDGSFAAAADLSILFDCDYQLPDKAIDLADKAGARTQVPMLSMKPPLYQEPQRSGVSSERREFPPPQMAALCRAATTAQMSDVEVEAIRLQQRIVGTFEFLHAHGRELS
jgi:ATP-dependent Clp protease ATP-binding subunit ClpC